MPLMGLLSGPGPGHLKERFRSCPSPPAITTKCTDLTAGSAQTRGELSVFCLHESFHVSCLHTQTKKAGCDIIPDTAGSAQTQGEYLFLVCM
jgi:hypothetical protein